MAKDLAALDKYIKSCISVFISLLCLTVITVAVSTLNLPSKAAIALALSIALVKGSMVAAIFMHLIEEKWLIFFSLITTVLFFFFLIFIPVVTASDVIEQVIRLSH